MSESVNISLTVVGEEDADDIVEIPVTRTPVTGDNSPLPTIIRCRLLPDGTVEEEPIPPHKAGTTTRCYINEEGHPAAHVPLTHYEDIPAGIWYEIAVSDLLKRGVLDATQRMFRPDDSAVRAEFAKVLVKLHGITEPYTPAIPSFDDATDSTIWYYPFVEEAGKRTWMKGYNNCYGTHPCMVKPGAPTSRAEAVAMIVRHYGLSASSRAPLFADVPHDAWYADEVQIAADHCIAQGDDLTGMLAPERIVNRAEMVTLFARAEKHMTYGEDCGPQPHASSWGQSVSEFLSRFRGFF